MSVTSVHIMFVAFHTVFWNWGGRGKLELSPFRWWWNPKRAETWTLFIYLRGQCDVMVQKLSKLHDHVREDRVGDIGITVEVYADVACVGKESVCRGVTLRSIAPADTVTKGGLKTTAGKA